MTSFHYITFYNLFSNKILSAIFLPFTLLVSFCFQTKAQHVTNKREITVLPVPAIGYSPETKTYVGAVSLFTFSNRNDTTTRSSNAEIEFNYTWNKQVIIESGWNYFTPGEKWFSSGLIHYSKYPDLYYGIGFDTPASNEVNFESNRVNLDFNLLRNIKKNNFVGAGLNYTSFNNIKFVNENEDSPVHDKSNFGIKAIYLHDSRNNILSPSKGNYFEFSNSFNLSSSNYSKTAADYRRYLSLGEDDAHVFAGRFYQESIWGNPPFYDYAKVGGDEYVRGYYLGRFRDKNLSLLQLEYRALLFWKIGVATFGGVAMIYDKLSNIQSESFKPNAGLGLRFLVDEDENTSLRIDYAVGAGGQSGFYISFGESF